MTKNFIRFIAGAVCPSCKEIDKIAITSDDQTIYCLSCDFKEHKPVESPPINQNLMSHKSLILKILDLKNPRISQHLKLS